MELNEILPDVLGHLISLGIEHIRVYKVSVLFPYLYWDLDRNKYYVQNDSVFESDLDSFISKLKDSEIKKHDLEDCFGCLCELQHDYPMIVIIHTDSGHTIERIYYVDYQ